MDKLRAITVFRRVIELGSFKAAAEDMALSKAAISKNINELEDYLETPLINRTTRKMHITESGQLYYEHIRTILDDLSNADLSIIESSNHLRGTIKVSIPMTFGVLQINPAICEFMRLNPEISIEIIMVDEYLDLVKNGLDVALRGGGNLKNSTIKSRKLLDLPRILCASPDYLEHAGKLDSPSDLHDHNCLVYSLSSSPRHWVFRKDGKVQVVDLSPGTYVVNNGLALKQAALAGLGVMLTPELFVRREIKVGELINLSPDWQAESHSLYAVYPYHKEQSQKVRIFIDFLVEYFKK
ncbi:HTH-type transcriptional regulator DmlR [Pseudoalteromonas holothuriae]|uniref:HTH-type transcriptional regulator DmlR n=1 Tax=Pseudoalteromonas holothuriae TaxID=2963714 RepID=A0A9W4QYI9_9GAMM|nr:MULTISPECIES: LysR family transcriptional regulator [unclassified Pseudoalteromonas]CAH9058187.1 HTH-type transcriptional regulator DmlR [Pseudoalteromonas sp. CIP111951]CAH9058498.1 HTH-type transcriptional regulator DmlR [Pseudoalteromonas sp. CIP111854]